jgi:hypothetical protein
MASGVEQFMATATLQLKTATSNAQPKPEPFAGPLTVSIEDLSTKTPWTLVFDQTQTTSSDFLPVKEIFTHVLTTAQAAAGRRFGRSHVWGANKTPNLKKWVAAVEDKESGVLDCIRLREWLNDPQVFTLLDDETRIAHVQFVKADGTVISEAEAIAINDQFDPSKPIETPTRKRSFAVVSPQTGSSSSSASAAGDTGGKGKSRKKVQ